MLVFNELRLKSKSLLIYSFITLLTLAFDKLIIKHIFGDTTLGVYSLAFLAYSMLMIFGGSLIGGNFKKINQLYSLRLLHCSFKNHIFDHFYDNYY